MYSQSAYAAVDARGGVARTTTLMRAGISRATIDAAARRGELMRVRRGWVATPSADPYLVSAARRGVVLTCVTEAQRQGLWVLKDDQPHVAAPAHSGHVAVDGALVHWHIPPLKRHPDDLADPIENVLDAVARCLPFEQALTVWESALRTHRVSRERMARLDLTPAGTELCAQAQLFADSGLETLLYQRLRWMDLPMLQQAWLLGRRVDLLIGDRLVIQVDGGHHVGAQRAADIAHDALLMQHGYHVIRVTYAQIVDQWIEVQRLITGAVAQGLHLAR